MKIWFNNYKVLIFGLISAIALPVYDLLKTGETSKIIIIFSVVTATLSYLSRNLRGQVATILGQLLTVAYSLADQITSGATISYKELIMLVLLQMIAIVAPPAKSRGYEHTEAIMDAKKVGEEIAPSSATLPKE